MIFGVLVMQVVGGLIWVVQLCSKFEVEICIVVQYLVYSVVFVICYFMILLFNYCLLMIQQLCEMGGMCFFINVNSSVVLVKLIGDSCLVNLVIDVVVQILCEDLFFLLEVWLVFVWLDGLLVVSDGFIVNDLFDNWVQYILLIKFNLVLVLVIQMQVESGCWIYLVVFMFNLYFFDSDNLLWLDCLVLQGLLLVVILLLIIFVVCWIICLLVVLVDVVEVFGKGEIVFSLFEIGSCEYVKIVCVFFGMCECIKCYLEDCECLFVFILYDLCMFIMCLKLCIELMDDDVMCIDFYDDFDELDMMVKGVL